jgi:hypothetical protein
MGGSVQFDASLFSAILVRTKMLMRATMPISVIGLGLATLGGVGLDYFTLTAPDSFAGLNLVYQGIMVAIIALVSGAALKVGGRQLAPGREFPFGTIFITGILTGIGILLGLILLVLPGLFLLARWYLAVPVLMAEGLSITDSMRRSWELTEQHWLGVIFVALVLTALNLVPLANQFLVPAGIETTFGWAMIIGTNAISACGVVGGYYAAVAAYDLIAGADGDREREIFG